MRADEEEFFSRLWHAAEDRTFIPARLLRYSRRAAYRAVSCDESWIGRATGSNCSANGGPLERDEGEVLAVRAPAHATAGRLPESNLPLLPAIDGHDKHVRHTAAGGNIGDLLAIRRDVRTIRGTMLVPRRQFELHVTVTLGETAEVLAIDIDAIHNTVAAEEHARLAVRRELREETLGVSGCQLRHLVVRQRGELQAVAAGRARKDHSVVRGAQCRHGDVAQPRGNESRLLAIRAGQGDAAGAAVVDRVEPFGAIGREEIAEGVRPLLPQLVVLRKVGNAAAIGTAAVDLGIASRVRWEVDPLSVRADRRIIGALAKKLK